MAVKAPGPLYAPECHVKVVLTAVLSGRAGAGDLAASKSCDASWTSAYPSVLHAVLKYYGDLQTPQKHWSSLTRFLDNEYSRIVTGGVTAMFANFGDWVRT